jgi:hypothetical protein
VIQDPALAKQYTVNWQAHLKHSDGYQGKQLTGPKGAHSSIKIRFYLGEGLLTSFNTLSTTINKQNKLTELWQKP